MKIGFLVERATQFEAPFFRFAARDRESSLRVLFTHPEPGKAVLDPELGQPVSWGSDLLAGYDHAVRPSRWGLFWLASQVLRGRFDLLVINGYTRWPYVVGAILARLAGVPTALRIDSVRFTQSAMGLRAKRLLFGPLLGSLFRQFLAVGSLSRRFLADCGVPAERVGLFPYSVDVEDFHRHSRLTEEERQTTRAQLGVPAGGRAILAVAKLNDREAPWDLLRASSFLSSLDLRLLIAGDGPERPELEAFAAGRLGKRVRFLGYVPYPELPRLYGAADLFVHAAQEERWGVSVAEALACELPVVASDRVGAAQDLIDPGGNGFVYPSGRPEELARRIAEALELDRALVAQASRTILSHWDYRATWRHLLETAARAKR